MANISTAEGDITLKGSVKSIKSFLVIMQHIADWNYTLYMDEAAHYIEALEGENGSTEETYPFFGIGRWTFENTLKYLFGWVDNERNDEVRWTADAESAWQQLNQDPLHITLSYIDYDNSEFMVKERAIIEWHKMRIDDAIVRVETITSYDMNAKHYDELTAEDYYDYSTYTIKKMNDKDVDWIEQIQSTALKDRIDLDVFQTHVKAILIDLGEYLEEMAHEYGNALWSEIPEWFADEEVQNGIERAVARHSRQRTR